MSRVPCAFYAPLKAPDHPIPSGDRTMARLLLAALEAAGFEPELASRLRSHDPAGDPERQREILAEGARDAERLVTEYAARSPGKRPHLWFTYHCYYKAPDHLGPVVAKRLGIPYVVAEGSRAPKRAGGPWALGHAAAEAALDAADTLFVATGHDRAMLAALAPAGQRLVDLPPFVEAVVERGATPRSATGLLAVAMMRDGDKLRSYRLLAEALALLPDRPWDLEIVGDGPARPEVERLFAPLGARVRCLGRLDGPALREAYGRAALLVWPAVNEAYGMALLEAQAAGCPVVAGAYGGVADAMRPGLTGAMPPAGDPAAFAAAVARLLDDTPRRLAMGEAARRFVVTERTVAAAAAILRKHLLPAVEAAA